MLGPQSVELFGERRRRHGLVEGVVSQGWALIFQMPLTFPVNSLSASNCSQLLFQHHACLPTALLPTTVVKNFHSEAVSKAPSKCFFLQGVMVSLPSKRTVTKTHIQRESRGMFTETSAEEMAVFL